MNERDCFCCSTLQYVSVVKGGGREGVRGMDVLMTVMF